MTRREEIELAWLSRAVQSNHRYDEKSFKEAVEWADKTMIERACKWLKFNTNWDDEWDDMGRNRNYGMIEEFRKAMEE